LRVLAGATSVKLLAEDAAYGQGLASGRTFTLGRWQPASIGSI
jgi:hypothetical protein